MGNKFGVRNLKFFYENEEIDVNDLINKEIIELEGEIKEIEKELEEEK